MSDASVSIAVSKDTITNRYTVDMRHVGQGYEITVRLPDQDLPKDGS